MFLLFEYWRVNTFMKVQAGTSELSVMVLYVINSPQLMFVQMSTLRLARKWNICFSESFNAPDHLTPVSALSRCMRSTVPPVLVLRRLSRSSQLESWLTRLFRLQPPMLQLTLHPMLLAGPSNLSQKVKNPCEHAHCHTLIHTHSLRS